ncbi:transposase [Ferruginibacter profundus]
MKTTYFEYWPQFFTATIHEWKHLLSKDEHENIIIESLRFLVAQKRITLFRFAPIAIGVVNHVHIIWQPLFGFTSSAIQSYFMKHTSKKLKASMAKNDTEVLATYKGDKYDRMYQIWKREPLSVEVRTSAVFAQKLDYINNNPVVVGLSNTPEAYFYSSVRFYHEGVHAFNMPGHYSGN